MNPRFFLRCFFVLALLSGAVAQAQTRVPARKPGSVAPRPRLSANGEGVKDGLSMVKGRMILTELGTSNPLTADKKLINGTVISTTGLVTATDGTTTQINEGDHVSLSGRVTTRQAIAAADSIAKIQVFDAKYPGKRKKMEEEAERKAKAKAKLLEERAKAKEKAAKKKKR